MLPRPCFVGLADALRAQNQRARREVGTRQQFQDGFQRAVRVFQPIDERVDDLAEVMRGDVGRHPDGDAAAAVAQQVRESRGQHGRLLRALQVVRHPVDGLFVDVGEHLHRDGGEAYFGVVVNEPVRDEGVALACHANRVDALRACVLDGDDGVEEVASFGRGHLELGVFGRERLPAGVGARRRVALVGRSCAYSATRGWRVAVRRTYALRYGTKSVLDSTRPVASLQNRSNALRFASDTKPILAA
jgi:hypothetical protein